MEQRVEKKRSLIAWILLCVFCVSCVSGCGDGITEETVAIVNDKTQKALDLYEEIDGMVQEHSLKADESFVNTRQALDDMSVKIQNSIKETTEEDGQLTIQELDRIISNLEQLKQHVTDMVESDTANN